MCQKREKYFVSNPHSYLQAAASMLLANVEREKELLRVFLKVSQMENKILRRMNLSSFLMVSETIFVRIISLLDKQWRKSLYPDNCIPCSSILKKHFNPFFFSGWIMQIIQWPSRCSITIQQITLSCRLQDFQCKLTLKNKVLKMHPENWDNVKFLTIKRSCWSSTYTFTVTFYFWLKC